MKTKKKFNPDLRFVILDELTGLYLAAYDSYKDGCQWEKKPNWKMDFNLASKRVNIVCWWWPQAKVVAV